MRTRDGVAGGRAPAGDRFASYIAHELRTPIAHQRLLAEAALADPGTDTRAMCEEIIAGCEEQQRLIGALLDLTRGRASLIDREPVNLASVMRQVLSAHDMRDLDCIVSLSPATSSGDRTLLERLCDNLVSNAIRHNVPHGRIEVATATRAGGAVLSVANTGPAVSGDELGRLFEPFERGGGRRGRTAGVGLGLAIVESIADAHDALVTARARAAGGLAIEVRF
jgi:signal transduction histidine kinase